MYLTHADLSKYIVIDIEANGLQPTQIWCAVAKRVSDNASWRLKGHDEIRRFVNEAPRETIWVGHNLVSYDIPVCNRLLGTVVPLGRCVDTLVLSYLYNPHIEADHEIKERRGHSLEAWALRLNVASKKVQIDDFSQYSDDLLARCATDVDINTILFKVLTLRMRTIGYSEESCEVEHAVREIIDRQEHNGWYFEAERATQLLGEFRQRQASLAEQIQSLFPPCLVPIKEYTLKKTKGGDPYQSYYRHAAGYPKLTYGRGTYTVWDWKDFNLGSPKQRVEKLLELGWKPERFTKTGGPSVDEESLVAAATELGKPELQALADWMVLQGRCQKLEEVLPFVQEDHRIHGRMMTCGAMSRRMIHNNPNTSNIPSNEAKFGRELRELWRATPGLVQVGYDAKSLQMRIFGHYLTDKEAAKRYYDSEHYGDPHKANAEAIACGESRRNAKNHFYAFIFGAQDPKLGKMVGKDPAFGAHVRATLYAITPGLQMAVDNAQDEQRRRKGRIKCLDGGFVNCPSERAAFNYLIQPGEVCVMKRAMIYVDQRLREAGIWHRKVGDNHDESQHELDRKDVQAFSDIACRAIRDAGEHFNLTVPLAGDCKSGTTWADTH